MKTQPQQQDQDHAYDPLRQHIKQELHRRNMTQAEFARRGQISDAAISQFLSGTRRAGPELVLAAYRVLKTPLAELYTYSGHLQPEPIAQPKPNNTTCVDFDYNDPAFFDALKDLSKEQREKVLEYILFVKSRG